MSPKSTKSKIALREFTDALNMTVSVAGRGSFDVETSDVYRPCMQCMGYFMHFPYGRVQMFGNAEMTYLSELDEATVRERLTRYFSYDIPVICLSRGYKAPPVMLELAR